MKRLIPLVTALVLLLAGLPAPTAAQPLSAALGVAAGYLWSQSVGTYTEITGGTQLGTSCFARSWNNLAIPFTFTFNGVDYTAISVECDGFLAMGTSVSNSYYPISAGSTNEVISALGMNLQTNTADSEIRMETLGDSPDRVVVVQWKNFRFYDTGGESYNFQIRLHETSNVIDVVYGPFAEGSEQHAEVGLRGNSAADYNNRIVASDWMNSTAGTSCNSAVRIAPGTLPPSGLTWTWTPLPPVWVWPDQADTTCPGDSTEYTLNVLNNSAAADTIDITLSGNAWPAEVIPTSLSLGAGETGQVVLTASIPAEASPADADTTTVTATARGSGATEGATVTTTAFGPGVSSMWEDRATGDEPDLYWGHSYYYGGNVCVVGGLTGQPSPVTTGGHWCYNIASATWTTRAPMPLAVNGGAYGLIGTKFYVAGGNSSTEGDVNTLQIYDIATDSWATGAPMPSDRFGQASGVVNSKLYSVGGGTFAFIRPDDPTDCPTYEYDPVANSWTTKASCPLQGGYGIHRGGGVGSDFHDRLFAGGRIDGGQGWFAFDPVANTWETLADLPHPFSPLIVENPEDGKIYSLGGMTSTWYPYGDTHEYDYAADQWTNLNLLMSTARGGALGPAHGSFGDPDFEGFWNEGGTRGNAAIDPAPFDAWLRGCYTCGPPPTSVTVSITAEDKAYDGTTDATITDCALTGVLEEDEGNVTCSADSAAFDSADAGIDKTVTASVSLAGSAAGSYVLGSGTVTTTATITQATATVSAVAANKTYGNADPTLITAHNGFVSSDLAPDRITFSASRDAGETVAGSPYAITPSASDHGTGLLDNYDVTYVPADFTIDAKTASVTPDDANKTYGDPDPSPLTTGTLSGFVTADAVEATYTRTSGEVVGSYTITATLAPAAVLANYSITYGTANFTIDPKVVSATVTAADKVYDGTTDATITDCALTGVLEADAEDVGCIASEAAFDSADAGVDKEVTASVSLDGPGANNYTLASETVVTTATIDKAMAEVILDDLEQGYDGQPKAVTVTTDPAGLAVVVTYDGAATPPTEVGSYAVVATVDDVNYEGSASGTLTITEVVVTLSRRAWLPMLQ